MRNTAITLGAGNRGNVYGNYSIEYPDEIDIVGVAEPIEIRRQRYALHIPQTGTNYNQLASRSFDVDSIVISQEIIIYPNPAHDAFTLRGSDNNAHYAVSIYNSTCQLVFNDNNFVGENTLSSIAFGTGLFIVTMEDKNTGKILTKKLMIE